VYDAAGVSAADVVELDGVSYMFYVGFEGWAQQSGTVITTVHQTVNLATSTDGETWDKHPDNPLPIDIDDAGQVKSIGARAVGSRIHLWVTDQYPELGGQQAVGYFLYEPSVGEPSTGD
jgi:hypothetical protein